MLYLLIVLMTGCSMAVDDPADYEGARQATVEAWELVIGVVGTVCYQMTMDTIITEVDVLEIKDKSHVIGRTDIIRVDGEIVQTQISILASRPESRKMDTAVHEYIHVLDACINGKDDVNHMKHKLWIDYGADTVEAVGCAGW